MNNKSIVWGFHSEKDLKEVMDKFDSTLVQSKGVMPPTIYRIIGRVGHDGSWVYREEGNKTQWYLCTFLDQFQKVKK